MDGNKLVRRALRASLFFTGLATASANASVLLSEVYYDAPSSDAGQVFVELFGTPGLILDGYELHGINGSDGSIYKTLAITGTIPTDGVFVIGDDNGGATAVANADMLGDVDFQNGPDSIALFDGNAIIDAIGYGDFAGSVFGGEGSPAPDVAGKSLARLLDTDDNLVDFTVLDNPTPGFSAVSAVPVPGAVYLMGSGLALLGTRLRRRRA